MPRKSKTIPNAAAKSPSNLMLPPGRSDLRLEVRYVAPTSLKRRNRQLRKHPPEQIDALIKSIANFGFVAPVLVDASGFLVSGHARIEAAQRLGLTEVPAISVEHLSDSEMRALTIADNRLAEQSEWDQEMLALELGELVELDVAGELSFDLDVIGFSTPEIDVILTTETKPAPETVELPAEDTRAVARPGDLWLLGTHRIFCGSALEAESYDRLLMEERVRLTLSDPPFNVPIAGHVSGTGRHREFAMASGEMSSAEFDGFLRESLARMREVAVPGGVLMVFMDWRHIHQLINAGEAEGLTLLNLCVWQKSNAGMGSLYRSQHELVAVFRAGEASHINNVKLGKHGRNRSNVWSYAGVNTFRKGRDQDLADHPTVKPTAMLMDAIRDVTKHGDLVLDPFGGSGSTLLAAERTGRRARLIELEPRYVDVAIRRWQALTRRQAEHAETGELWDDRLDEDAVLANAVGGAMAEEVRHDQA